MTIATILLTKIVVATSIAALAAMVQRRSVYAELAYAVWFSVLVVLLIPALVAIPVPAWVATNLETAVSSGLAVFGWAGALGAQRSGVLAAVLTVVPESSNILPVTVLLVWLVGCGLVLLPSGAWSAIDRAAGAVRGSGCSPCGRSLFGDCS